MGVRQLVCVYMCTERKTELGGVRVECRESSTSNLPGDEKAVIDMIEIHSRYANVYGRNDDAGATVGGGRAS